MKKRLLLISYNFYPEPTGIGKYNGEMISWFVSKGYDCTVITSYPYYPYWKIQEPYYKKRFWYTIEESCGLQVRWITSHLQMSSICSRETLRCQKNYFGSDFFPLGRLAFATFAILQKN
jgi:hypothetical protein